MNKNQELLAEIVAAFTSRGVAYEDIVPKEWNHDDE